MIKTLFKAAAVLSVALLYGCASTPSADKMQAEVANYALPKAAVAERLWSMWSAPAMPG